jgi:hypothetical protein
MDNMTPSLIIICLSCNHKKRKRFVERRRDWSSFHSGIQCCETRWSSSFALSSYILPSARSLSSYKVSTPTSLGSIRKPRFKSIRATGIEITGTSSYSNHQGLVRSSKANQNHTLTWSPHAFVSEAMGGPFCRVMDSNAAASSAEAHADNTTVCQSEQRLLTVSHLRGPDADLDDSGSPVVRLALPKPQRKACNRATVDE